MAAPPMSRIRRGTRKAPNENAPPVMEGGSELRHGGGVAPLRRIDQPLHELAGRERSALELRHVRTLGGRGPAHGGRAGGRGPSGAVSPGDPRSAPIRGALWGGRSLRGRVYDDARTPAPAIRPRRAAAGPEGPATKPDTQTTLVLADAETSAPAPSGTTPTRVRLSRSPPCSPSSDDVLVVGRPLHHALAHQLVGPELEVSVWPGCRTGGGGCSPGTRPMRNTEPRWSTEWKSATRHRHVGSGVLHRHRPGAGGGGRLVGQTLAGDDRPADGDPDVERLRLHLDGQSFDLERRLGHRADQRRRRRRVEGLLRQEGRVLAVACRRATGTASAPAPQPASAQQRQQRRRWRAQRAPGSNARPPRR